MIRRVGIFAFVLFQALWLNVILPGHTRGLITVPGSDPASCHSTKRAAASSHSCCPSSSRPDPSGDPKPGDGRAARCAVCFFAARLTLPTTIDLTPAPLELLEVRDVPAGESLVALDCFPTYLGRGPPAA